MSDASEGTGGACVAAYVILIGSALGVVARLLSSSTVVSSNEGSRGFVVVPFFMSFKN